MKLFTCQHCSQVLYFENTTCEGCKRRLGYLPNAALLTALEPDGEQWATLASPRQQVRFCANVEFGVCNWLISGEEQGDFCASCRHNRTVPDLKQADNHARWRSLEAAKHRLFYSLKLLDLPLANRVDDPAHGLVFDFLAEATTPGAAKVLTGHDNGLITLNLNEADDAHRELMRQRMGEPYRTLLGHFRHEVGHYFWDVLVRDAGQLDAFRAIFGDETADYGKALAAHYQSGPPPDWREHHISAYATTHPWEDFAEIWAHYLHIIDTLETARAFGLKIHPDVVDAPGLHTELDFDPYGAPDIDTIIAAWLPLTFAMNSLSRSMGHADLYPFILSPDAIAKLGFIHGLVRRDQASSQAGGCVPSGTLGSSQNAGVSDN